MGLSIQGAQISNSSLLRSIEGVQKSFKELSQLNTSKETTDSVESLLKQLADLNRLGSASFSKDSFLQLANQVLNVKNGVEKQVNTSQLDPPVLSGFVNDLSVFHGASVKVSDEDSLDDSSTRKTASASAMLSAVFQSQLSKISGSSSGEGKTESLGKGKFSSKLSAKDLEDKAVFSKKIQDILGNGGITNAVELKDLMDILLLMGGTVPRSLMETIEDMIKEFVMNEAGRAKTLEGFQDVFQDVLSAIRGVMSNSFVDGLVNNKEIMDTLKTAFPENSEQQIKDAMHNCLEDSKVATEDKRKLNLTAVQPELLQSQGAFSSESANSSVGVANLKAVNPLSRVTGDMGVFLSDDLQRQAVPSVQDIAQAFKDKPEESTRALLESLQKVAYKLAEASLNNNPLSGLKSNRTTPSAN